MNQITTRNEKAFELTTDFKATGDQPAAIKKLVAGLEENQRFQTLMGATGSGKTFTMANVIEKLQRPTLVVAHNKTLAAQLAEELREFFPNNAVEYFVSYYDYYQPEAYVPRTDTYVEKEADVNDEIDKFRHAATRSLWERRDVIVVASVSCIYGLGAPDEYHGHVLRITKGQHRNRNEIIHQLVDLQYERNDMDLVRGRFRVRGDTIEILPANDDIGVRVEFFGDEIERIIEVDPLTGELLSEREHIGIYPAKHFVTGRQKLLAAIDDIEEEAKDQVAFFRDQNRLVEAQRIEERTRYDVEMLREAGYCAGVENYSRHLARREAGSTPWCLLDYFPDDFLLFIDESHMTIPQFHGMYYGDLARKNTLVEFGFRLPSALDNRPLKWEEFESHINQAIFVSATPGPYEKDHTGDFVEQIIRPTGILDPTIEVKPTEGQIDDLIDQIKTRVKAEQRCLVTTLTKNMAERLADYLTEMGIKTQYMHADVETLQRTEILRDLRLGVYDVLVGINLLREGLDLPEVSLIAILDADKEGYLRSRGSLIQTMGRAARHTEGHVIMYADTTTDSMARAIEETYRRREIQYEYNQKHGISPKGIQKTIRDISHRVKNVKENRITRSSAQNESSGDIQRLITELENHMKKAAQNLEFERAAILRDEILDLRKILPDKKHGHQTVDMIRQDL
jgi:excinuclease ABC subunit B